MQFDIAAYEPASLRPAPTALNAEPFPTIVQLTITGLPPPIGGLSILIPPPSWNAQLLAMVQFESTGRQDAEYTPPPASALLSMMTQRETVGLLGNDVPLCGEIRTPPPTR